MIGAWLVPMLPALVAGWVIKVSLLLSLALFVTLLLGRASAAVRHGIWALAVFGALLLPLGTLLLPRLEVAVPWLFERSAVWSTPSPDAQVAVVPALDRATAVIGELPDPERAAVWSAVTPEPMPAPGAGFSGLPDMEWSGFERAPLSSFAADVASVMLPIWLVVALGLIARTLVSQRSARRLERELLDATGTRVDLFVQRIAHQRGIRGLHVLIGPADAMPATWGAFRPVLLLPSDCVHWTPPRLEAVARHELAHVARRDVQVQLAAELLCALHWFNPMTWLAAYRLRVERELACDDEVLAAGARPSDYAADLVVLARTFRDTRLPAAAVAMTRRGKLRMRVEAVLDPSRARGEPVHGLRRALQAAVALVFVLLAAVTPTLSSADTTVPMPLVGVVMQIPPLPAPAPVPGVDAVWSPPGVVGLPALRTPLRAPAVPGLRAAPMPAPWIPLPQVGTLCWDTMTRGSNSVRRNDDITELEWSAGDCRVRIRIEGDLQYNADYTAITGVAGFARFEERDGRRERRIELRERGGALEHRWLVDGDEQPYGAEAEEWLAAMLLNAFRAGGLAAEERVAWMLRERGVDAVIAEIPHLRGDWVRSLYYQAALSDPSLDNGRIAELLEHVGSGIGSDHAKMEVLQRVAERRSLSDVNVRRAYIEAASTIGSDHARARSLEAALGQPDLSTQELASILDAVSGIGSDHEKMQLLVAMAERHRLDAELRSAYLRVATSIGSDHALGRTAHALLDAGEPSESEVELALDVADRIGSDHERSMLLVRLADANLGDAGVRAQFERGLAGIGSDYSLGQVLLALMEDGADEVTASVVLRGVERIGSDHTRGEVLVRLVRAGGVTDATRAAFDEAVDDIGSRYTRDQVLNALRR